MAMIPGFSGLSRFSAIPGLDTVVSGVLSVMQAQTAALAALPGAVESLSAAVRNLAEATADARDTVQTVNRLAHRMESIVEELEEPLRALAPGMTRLAGVLDDPIISTVPEVLVQLQDDMLPVLRTIADTHKQVATLAGFAGIPGAALLGRRRPTS